MSTASASPAVIGARVLPAVLLLGIASGLPNPLVGDLLATWLTKAGWTPGAVIAAGWVTLPYALKFLWAPVVDRWVPPLLGRRRGWLALTQLAVAAGLLAMAGGDPAAPTALMVLATVVAVASATQDLVVNAYTIEALPASRLAAGAGLSVWGYRLVVLALATAVPLIAARWGWGAAYAFGGALMACGAVGTWMAPEPTTVAVPTTWRESLLVPWRGFVVDLGLGGVVLLLAFVLLYRLPDGMAGLYVAPFLATQYDLNQLALKGIGGLVGAGIGVALASWLIPRIGLYRCLWWFALAQAFSNVAYVAIAHGLLPGGRGLLTAVVIDNACGALAATAFVTLLMGYCRSACAATQYALLTAIGVTGPHLLRLFKNLPDTFGWSTTFLITIIAVLPGLALLTVIREARSTSTDVTP